MTIEEPVKEKEIELPPIVEPEPKKEMIKMSSANFGSENESDRKEGEEGPSRVEANLSRNKRSPTKVLDKEEPKDLA